MNTWAVLASGPSMNMQVASAVRGRCKVMAVSDSYRLAPWADALCSTDGAWWRFHAEALAFAGQKFCTAPEWKPVRGVLRAETSLGNGTNSGLLACEVAVRLGACRLLLCGFDLGGTHFFGPHPTPLKNTTAERFEQFKKQFAAYRPRGVEILNCTPGSRLDCYPKRDLNACLAELAPH